MAPALLLLAACAPRPFDAAAEGRKLLQRDADWARAAADGKDIDRIVSYWADDAIVMEPGQEPVEGMAAIRAYVTTSLHTPGFKIHWVSSDPVFSADGTLAYMRGRDEMTAPNAHGALTTVQMRGVSIWRRDPDGVWRCVVDISNELPTP
ncbi:MAG: nuclear transport factor 2 family protein [Proteobacteria bacterium]|nr:nuclear transport factor 2 family protein [Pseudomonadota bacterium]